MNTDTISRMRTPAFLVAPNGLTVVASSLPTTPMVQAHLAVPLDLHDGMDLAALDILSSTWTDLPECRELENLGGAIALARRRKWLILSVTSPRHSLNAIFDVLRAVTSAHVTDDSVRAFAPRCRQQSVQVRANPSALSSALMWTRLYGQVPSALTVAPDPDAVDRVSLADVVGAHRRHVRPAGAHLVLVGDLDQSMAAESAAGALASWSPAPEDHDSKPAFAPVGTPSIQVHNRPELPSNHVRLVAPSLPTSHPDAFTSASLASLVLGGNFSSRLNTIVRETAGLAYRTMSMLTDHGNDVVLCVEADVAVGKCGKAMELISSMLLDLASEGPTDQELVDAVGFTVGSHELALGSQYGRASCLVSYLTMGLGVDAIARIPDALAAVTHQDVHDMFRTFTPQSFWGVLAGPDGQDGARGEFCYE
ncbi:M16 family metallopeptidase [Actinomycetes bacterium M1A6_2h]